MVFSARDPFYLVVRFQLRGLMRQEELVPPTDILQIHWHLLISLQFGLELDRPSLLQRVTRFPLCLEVVN